MLDKTFREILGTVPSKNIRFYQDGEKKKFVFRVVEETGETHDFEVDDKRILTKFGELYGFSYQKLCDDLKGDKASIKDTEDFIKASVKNKPRKVVALVDRGAFVNIVSEKHRQLPMGEIDKMIKEVIGGVEGVRDLGTTDTENSYRSSYEVGTTAHMSIRVNIEYGRNDAKGRASIRFDGGGHIFVCSNMIIPYVHKEIRVSANIQSIQKPKIIHTLLVTEHTKKNILTMFNQAKETAIMMEKAIVESEKIPMERVLQEYALKLINAKHKLGDKWLDAVMLRLKEENETLYGLSQALTYVGTRADVEYMKRKLCELGGQVAFLGKELVPLMEKNLKEHNVPLANIRRE